MDSLKIIVKNNKVCKIESSDEKLIKNISKLLSYKQSGVEYTQAYKNGWDGITRLLSKKNEFGIGLLGRLKEYLNINNISYSIEDKRKKLINSDPLNLKLNVLNITPRDYQVRALEKTMENDQGIIRAATGSGKCNNVDSINLTEFGMLSYREILENINQENLNDGYACKLNMEVSTPLNNGSDNTSMIYHDGYSLSKKITTKYGYSVTGTLDHKIKVIDSTGNFLWKRMENLTNEDYAVVSYNNQMFGKEHMSNDEAYWLGLLIGDGSFVSKGIVTLTNMDKHIIDFSLNYLRFINLKPKIIKGKSKAIDIKVFSTKYRKYLFDLGFGYEKSISKKIPKSIRMLKKEPLSYFIRGIYEADGWVEIKGKSRVLCLGLSNEKIIDQIHLILLNFGIVASKSCKKTKKNNSYKLSIHDGFVDKFLQEIGLDKSGHKYKKVTSIVGGSKEFKNNNVDLVPNQKEKIKNIRSIINKNKIKMNSFKENTIRSWTSWRNPSKLNLNKFINEFEKEYKQTEDSIKLNELSSNDYIYLKIESIENIMSDNYDFCIPKTHSFISQGFINHNTLIAAQITAQFNKPTIIYVIGLDLLQQFHDLFSKIFDEEIGWIGDGVVNPKRITIASVWTLGSALDLKGNIFLEDDIVKELPVNIQDKIKIIKALKDAKVHLIDECHVCTCNTLQQIYKFIDPERIYGLSGTPFRDDGSDMLTEAMLGQIIVDISASELIEKKVLAQPIIKFVNVPGRTCTLKTYKEIYKDYIVDNEVRNNIITKQTKNLIEKKYVPLVLFKTINHGKILHDLFLNNGINCGFLYGNDSLDKRTEIKDKLNNGEIDCILASTIFDIGLDLPKLSALVLAGSGKSRVRVLQRIGRVIRKNNAYPKDKAAIVDFMDNVRMLDKHSKMRYDTYLQEKGFKILGT